VTLRERIDRTDNILMRASGKVRVAALDRGMLELSGAANHSLIWMATAGILALRKGPTRRAAVRGMAAVAGAGFCASLVAKRLLPRRRPAADLLAVPRRLVGRPSSSSFPSGHAASAAAFTVAVAIESPLAGAVIAPLAAAVSYSRVHTGVHWPSDVVAGAAVGAAIGLATLHWWPRLPDRPHCPAEAVLLPALDSGDGVLFLVNAGSGGGVDTSSMVAARWPAAKVVEARPERGLVQQLTEEIGTGKGIRALGVAGGDGTVAAAAGAAVRAGLPLVIVPTGTLNHFARDLGVEEGEALTGAVRVGLGTVAVDGADDRWFVNTASVGGYPPMIRLREKLEPSWGKWIAGALATLRTLRRTKPLDVVLDGRKQRIWMLFVGNDDYRPKGMAPMLRPSLGSGVLDIRYVRADVPLSRTRFLLALATGTLNRSRTYRQCDLTELTVESPGRPVTVATDGEIGPVGRKFYFRARPAALDVYHS
jgi:undecaprenyl-diphosphatase